MRQLGQAWEKWKIVARRIGRFQSLVILTVFYIVFMLPAAIYVYLRGERFMVGWRKSEVKLDRIDELREQY